MIDRTASPARRRTLGLLMAAGAASAFTRPLRAANTADTASTAGNRGAAGAKLRALLESSEAAARRLEPLRSDGQRPAPGDPAFPNPLSDEHAAARRSLAEADLRALREIDVTALSAAEWVAYETLRYRSTRELERFRSGIAEILLRVPLNASSGLHVEVADYVSGAGASFETLEDYASGLERIAGFAAYLDSMRGRLREGLKTGHVHSQLVASAVLAQIDALRGLPLERHPFYWAILHMPATFPLADRTRLERAYADAIERRLQPALAQLASFLRDAYLPRALAAPGRHAMRDGERVYAADLAYHTTQATTARDLHEVGLAEVARIRAGMEATRARIGFAGSLSEFFEHVRTDPKFYFRRPEDLIAKFEEIEGRIWKAIPRLFERSPRAPFEVRGLPALGDHRSTGYYRPGPPDGTSPGVLWFNMSMLGTRPIPTLETLTLHEGIPGHHFQITLAREDETLPSMLRFGGLTAYSEGWALYAESLGPELGMFGDPYQYFGHLDMEMLRAVRLVVDTGLHQMQWSRQKAIEYMLSTTSMARRDVEVEIDRYISWPGQACAYKPGALKIQELRTEARKALGARFDLRAFHTQVIGTGAMPLAVLEAKLRKWIAGAA